MNGDAEEPPIWVPDGDRLRNSGIAKYIEWLQDKVGLEFDGYDELWRWSVERSDEFWRTLWEFFGIKAQGAFKVVRDGWMPKARWFVGAELNYAENMLRRAEEAPDDLAVVGISEARPKELRLSWSELRDRVGHMEAFLESLGVGKGDVVAAVMPNIPETLIAMLSTTAMGAVWSALPPELGPDSLAKRLSMLRPKVVLAVDGYVYSGKRIRKGEDLLKALRASGFNGRLISLSYLEGHVPGSIPLEDGLAGRAAPKFQRVPSDHPLWVLFTSGTTGVPKAPVHGHAGITLESNKVSRLCSDFRVGDVVLFFSSTGWVAWNRHMAALMVGGSVAMYDGNPLYPSPENMWGIVERLRASYVGLASSLIIESMRRGLSPGRSFDLRGLRSIGVTAAPLQAGGFKWILENVREDVWIDPMSGGTEVFTDLIAGVPIVPVYAGVTGKRCLGVDAESYDERGHPLRSSPGELVVRQPIPSMPIYLLNDEDFSLYKSTYFDLYDGIWRHGDFVEIRPDGYCTVLGRSDATIKRKGVRLGTGEIYEVVESLPFVADSLAVGVEDSSGETLFVLLVSVKSSVLDEGRKAEIRRALRERLSPRYVPDEIVEVRSIPRTLNGKKVEIPVRRVLMGIPPERAVDLSSLSDPEAFWEVVEAIRSSLRSREASAGARMDSGKDNVKNN